VILLCLGLLFSAVPPGQLIDRVIAVIDKEAITESELVMEARVALALRTGEKAAGSDLAPTLLQELQDYVINQLLVAAQARRLGAADISDDDVNGRLRQFMQRFHSTESYQQFLQRHGISESMVRNILRRDLGNEVYIARRMKTRVALPSDAGEQSDEELQERYEKALAEWLSELRQSADIRILRDHGELESITK
jgi:hypothetical protein